jgi:hypothetical protein
VTAGGKHVAGRLRPSPRWSGFSSSCTRSPWGHPPSACCGFRGWVPPRWTSSRRHWPDSLVHRQPARCHGRHLLWTSSCLHDRTLASEPGPSCKRELHHAVLDCRPRGATQRANSRSRSMDSRIDGRLGYHSRESFRRTAAKRTSPLGRARVVSPHRGQNDRLTFRARGRSPHGRQRAQARGRTSKMEIVGLDPSMLRHSIRERC